MTQTKTTDRKALDAALKKLCLEYGPSLVYDASKDATLEHLRSIRYGYRGKFVGYHISEMLPYPRELLYSTEDRYPWESLQVPGQDHVSLYEIRGERIFYSEPYGMSWADLVETVAFCQEHNLQASISGLSAHNPGATFTIEYRYVKPEDR